MANYIMTDYGPVRIVSRKTVSDIERNISEIKNSISNNTIEKLNSLLDTINEIEQETGMTLSEVLLTVTDLESNYVEKQDIIDPNEITNDKYFD